MDKIVTVALAVVVALWIGLTIYAWIDSKNKMEINDRDW
jgi:hypothetical protein